MTNTKWLAAAAIMLILNVGVMHGRDNCVRYHLEAPILISDTVFQRPVDVNDTLEGLSVEVRASLRKVREGIGMSKSWWGVSLTAPSDTVKVSLRFGNTDYGDMLDRRIAILTVERDGNVLARNEVDGFRMAGGDFNSLEMSLTDGMLSVDGGGHHSRHLTMVSIGNDFIADGVAVWSVGALDVSVFAIEACRPPYVAFASGYTPDMLTERFGTSTDPIEGYWTYFDRENDPAYARPGGRYILALVRRVPDDAYVSGYIPACYDIVYVDGAQTFGDKWKPMMLKGRLNQTIFEGHYDLQWIDATFERMTDDIHATIENASLLTLSFPMLKTTMRFSKMPARLMMPAR